jgi:hypothetical protein
MVILLDWLGTSFSFSAFTQGTSDRDALGWLDNVPQSCCLIEDWK